MSTTRSTSTETPPVSLRLLSGSLRIPQTGARDSARLNACSSHQRVCVFRWARLFLHVTFQLCYAQTGSLLGCELEPSARSAVRIYFLASS